MQTGDASAQSLDFHGFGFYWGCVMEAPQGAPLPRSAVGAVWGFVAKQLPEKPVPVSRVGQSWPGVKCEDTAKL